MMSDLNISHGKMSDFVSFPLFRSTLVMKLRNLNFKVCENTLILKLIFLNLGICCQIKICPGFFCLIYIFRHYCRNSFNLKKFLLILRYIEII